MRYRTLALFGGALLAGALVLGTFGTVIAQTTPQPPGWAPGGPGWMPGHGMMGNGPMGGPGMMGGPGGTGVGPMNGPAGTGVGPMNGPGMAGGPWAGTGTPLQSIADAQGAFQAYIDRLGNPNLALDEVMEFSQNFYAIVEDTSTGSGAFELLANKQNGAVFLEYGPAMMWNTEYGHGANGHGGMMGAGTTSGATQTVSADRAQDLAQQWLDANLPGSQTEAPDAFPGYYTMHFMQNGQITGMLSVNAYSGQVWYHSWHGAFVGSTEMGH